jgi:hypothetical protein
MAQKWRKKDFWRKDGTLPRVLQMGFRGGALGLGNDRLFGSETSKICKRLFTAIVGDKSEVLPSCIKLFAANFAMRILFQHE